MLQNSAPWMFGEAKRIHQNRPQTLHSRDPKIDSILSRLLSLPQLTFTHLRESRCPEKGFSFPAEKSFRKAERPSSLYMSCGDDSPRAYTHLNHRRLLFEIMQHVVPPSGGSAVAAIPDSDSPDSPKKKCGDSDDSGESALQHQQFPSESELSSGESEVSLGESVRGGVRTRPTQEGM